MNFDEPKDWRGTGSTKWDAMAGLLGRDDPDAIPMWVASMDFPAADFLLDRARAVIDQGYLSYFIGTERMFEATARWQHDRHGWAADPATMFAVHGLGNGIAVTLQALTEPGDGVIVFSPVYHEFRNKIERNGRVVVESPLSIDADGLFRMDLDALEASLTGTEKLVLISQPHNPAGRIWTAEELRALGALCDRHDLVLVSDEIHQDLVMPGLSHVPAASALAGADRRLVVMGAASKTFNIAGLRTGWVAIPDPDLRARFARLHRALDIQPNRIGMELTAAAYSDEGAAWVDDLRRYLDGNRALFCDGVNAIPGLRAMPMQGTYLAWVDYSGTGMSREEIDRRVKGVAKLCPTPGPALGRGGELCDRFNIGTRRALVSEALDRLRDAFGDLQ